MVAMGKPHKTSQSCCSRTVRTLSCSDRFVNFCRNESSLVSALKTLLFFTVLMVTLPIGLYFASKAYIFEGELCNTPPGTYCSLICPPRTELPLETGDTAHFLMAILIGECCKKIAEELILFKMNFCLFLGGICTSHSY